MYGDSLSVFSSSNTVITFIMNGGVGRMQCYPIRKGQARVQVQAVKWVVLQHICQTRINKTLGMNSKRVNANAPTLER